MKFLAFAPLLLCGCFALTPPNDSSDHCRTYDENYVTWYALGIASGSLAGATGASGVLTATLIDEPYADLGLAISSTVFGAFAAVSNALAGMYASRYTTCESETDVPVTGPASRDLDPEWVMAY